MLSIAAIIALLLLGLIVYSQQKSIKEKDKFIDSATRTAIRLEEDLKNFKANFNEVISTKEKLVEELELARLKNSEILSQKKSSETRLGQISEHLVPFLENCKHNPKDMHFLGNPIDYLVFDFDEGSITFLEVKSGNSKPSRRQKTVKHIIKSGRVFYEELRINEKGIKTKTAENT